MTRPPSSCDWRVFCLNMGWDLLRNEEQQLVSSTVRWWCVVRGQRVAGGRERGPGVGAVQGQFGDRTTHGQSNERSVRSPCV